MSDDDVQQLDEIEVLRIQVAVMRDRAAAEGDASSMAIATQAALASRYKSLYEAERTAHEQTQTALRQASLPVASQPGYTAPTATTTEDSDDEPHT